jgi:hypothetical protein
MECWLNESPPLPVQRAVGRGQAVAEQRARPARGSGPLPGCRLA